MRKVHQCLRASLSRRGTPPSRRLSAAAPHLAVTASSPRASRLFLPAAVELTRALTPSVRLLRLRLVTGAAAAAAASPSPLPPDFDAAYGGAPLEFEAGQWLDVAVPGLAVVGGFSLVSIARAPQAVVAAAGCATRGSFDLAVKRGRSPPAAWAHDAAAAAAGAIVGVRVGGAFTFNRALRSRGSGFRARHAVFVAGGVGLNPLYAMLLELAAAHARGEPGAPRATLLLSARTSDELLFRAELEGLARGPLRGALELRHFVTREENEKNGAAGGGGGGARRRRVSAEDVCVAIGDGAESVVVVICGPPPFADAAAEAARAAGVPEDRVVLERWW